MSPLTLAQDPDGMDVDSDIRMGDGIRSPAPEPEDGGVASGVQGPNEPNGSARGARGVDKEEEVGQHDQGEEAVQGSSQAYVDSPRPGGRFDIEGQSRGSTDTSAVSAASSALACASSDTLQSGTETSSGSGSNDIPTTTAPASANLDAALSLGPAIGTGPTSNDPAHQPYLGRVDELDTGPLPIPTTSPSSSSSSTSNSTSSGGSGGAEEEDEHRRKGRRLSNALSVANVTANGSSEGTGEGGTMTPHGMSDRPVPISSTTSVPADDADKGKGREVAQLPRRASVIGLAAQAEDQEEQSEGNEGPSASTEVEKDVDAGEAGKPAESGVADTVDMQRDTESEQSGSGEQDGDMDVDRDEDQDRAPPEKAGDAKVVQTEAVASDSVEGK